MYLKYCYFLALSILLSSAAFSQIFRGVDKSPMDMAYFPDHFAHDRKDGDKALIRVVYSRPQKGGRAIFGTTVPYGKVWRTGANESTEIKFYQDVTFGGKTVKAGTYALFTIPGEKEWTIILNSDLDFWGAYKYNEKNDVLRITAPVSSLPAAVENFAIQFQKKEGNAGVMRLAWDTAVVEIPIAIQRPA